MPETTTATSAEGLKYGVPSWCQGKLEVEKVPPATGFNPFRWVRNRYQDYRITTAIYMLEPWEEIMLSMFTTTTTSTIHPIQLSPLLQQIPLFFSSPGSFWRPPVPSSFLSASLRQDKSERASSACG